MNVKDNINNIIGIFNKTILMKICFLFHWIKIIYLNIIIIRNNDKSGNWIINNVY